MASVVRALCTYCITPVRSSWLSPILSECFPRTGGFKSLKESISNLGGYSSGACLRFRLNMSQNYTSTASKQLADFAQHVAQFRTNIAWRFQRLTLRNLRNRFEWKPTIFEHPLQILSDRCALRAGLRRFGFSLRDVDLKIQPEAGTLQLRIL